MTDFPLWLIPGFFAAGALYGSVGHGGATAYLALMSLAGILTPGLIPFVLVVNVAVAIGSFIRYAKQGLLPWKILAAFAATSVPAAFLGGAVPLRGTTTSILLSLSLLAAGLRFLLLASPHSATPASLRPRPSLAVTLPAGAFLGFLSGAVGIGGGVFLSPLLILARWADPKATAAISSGFIVLNSLSGLVARHADFAAASSWPWPLLVAGFLGGSFGGWAGAQKLSRAALVRVLGAVLVVAALKHGLDTLARVS
ncbi:MAG: sulfite exporter TauE/SafE family protein [Nitrospirae bacterium]|nr:sulfite exporter TauE/SafE family protein [Nitrospirota bacterium]